MHHSALRVNTRCLRRSVRRCGATTIRAEVNAGIFARIAGRMGTEGQQRLQALLTVAADGKSMFSRLKKSAQRATWSRFKAQAEYLDQVDELGDTVAWLEGIAPSKVADFAGEAAAQDIDTLSRYDPVKRLALVACLVHTARMPARDDLAEMLCKRVAANVKRAKAELEEIRLRQRAVSERLIGTYRTVLEHLDPDGETATRAPGTGAARAAAAIEDAGGFAAELAGIGGKDAGEYRRTLQRALDDAHAGKFSVLVVWALDRITRDGAEGALRIIRQFRQRGCAVVSVRNPG